MRTRANKNYVASVSVFTSVVARRASLALSNAAGARMCQGTFFVIYTRLLDKRITIVYHQDYESYSDSYIEVI